MLSLMLARIMLLLLFKPLYVDRLANAAHILPNSVKQMPLEGYRIADFARCVCWCPKHTLASLGRTASAEE